MANLTFNRPFPKHLPDTGVIMDMVVTTGSTVYEGSFVVFTAGTGTIAPMATTSVPLAGIAMKKVSVATAGQMVPVLVGGVIVHSFAAVAQGDIGKVIFADDDQTLTLTSTNNAAVGRIINVDVTNLTATIKMKVTGQVSGSVGTTYDAGPL